MGDVRAILAENDDHDGREQVRRKLEALLGDPGFRAAYLDPGEDGMTQIYEDPDLCFCVLAYNMTAPRNLATTARSRRVVGRLWASGRATRT